MRLRSTMMVLAAGLLVLVTGGPSTRAEGDSFMMRETLSRGGGSWPFVQRQRIIYPERRMRVAPAQPRRPAPAIVREQAPAAAPKAEADKLIAVMGDSLGGMVGEGLADEFAERTDIGLLIKARADSGLVRSDFHDWPKAVAEALASSDKIKVGVMLVGLNDRQPIREGDEILEPLSPRWREIYRQRIDTVIAAFAAKRVPLVWVGAPPVQNGRLSSDLVNFNELFREQVERAGGQYVDLWGGFVDAENRYAAAGPDVDGQTVRLRVGDGIHFTAAGARKAAHFAAVAVRRIIDGGQPPAPAAPSAAPAIASAAPSSPPVGIEKLIDSMISALPELGALSPALRTRPVAGPVLPLNTAPAPEKALLSSAGEARGQGEIQADLDRFFQAGLVSAPRSGRIDDHRWPR